MEGRFRKARSRTALLFTLSYLIVMIVPLSISLGFYYPRMRAMLIDNATKQASSMAIQVKNEMDVQLLNVLSMPSYIIENPRIILKDIMSDSITRLHVKQDLEQMIRTNDFISHIFLYIKDSNYFIVTRSSTFYFDDLERFHGVYQTTFGDWNNDDLYESLENSNALSIRVANEVMIAGARYSKTLFFLMPFPSSKHAYCTLIIAVPTVRLDSMINSSMRESGSFLFYKKGDTLLHATTDLSVNDQALVTQEMTRQTAKQGTLQIRLSKGDSIITWSVSQRYGLRYVYVLPMTAIIGEAIVLQQNTLIVLALVITISFLLIYLAMRMNYMPIKRLAGIAKTALNTDENNKNDFDAIRHMITTLNNQNDQMGKRLDMAELPLREYLGNCPNDRGI